ncbi:hypothetical protein E1A91_D11G326300v1 [Gossypium mustelinum]|uniref:Uncharacterized protein n=1 Tax=Gossypium mustelinum TaxID=34275 RepID=A0A5D2SYP2_GOSMU|nr:hypothetical protein E1A91_D11G326300v1 [Gossypium mustelinum]
MVSPENTNYWSSFDYATLINDIPAPNGPYSGFSWPTRPINASSNVFRQGDGMCFKQTIKLGIWLSYGACYAIQFDSTQLECSSCHWFYGVVISVVVINDHSCSLGS